MSDIVQTSRDIEAVTPYMWEITAVCWILVSLTITQIIKKCRFWPAFMCNLKEARQRRDGDEFVRYYKKLKPRYLKSFATLLSFAGIAYALAQRYDNLEQICFIAGIAAVLQWKIVDIVFARTEKTNPELADKLRNGIYIPEEDATVFNTILAKATGGGVDKRDKNDG